jgi:hypothetical protein
MTGSAKQSIAPEQRGLLRRFAPRNDGEGKPRSPDGAQRNPGLAPRISSRIALRSIRATAWIIRLCPPKILTDSNFKQPHVRQTRLRDLAARSARVLPETSRLPRDQRAQGMPGARCARSLACSKKTRELVTTVTPEIARHSPRNGFTAYFAFSPATNSSCHRRCRIDGWSNPVGPDLPPTAWHQQRVSERRDLAVRKKRRSSCAPHFAHEVHLALRLPFAPDALASTASRAQRP